MLKAIHLLGVDPICDYFAKHSQSTEVWEYFDAWTALSPQLPGFLIRQTNRSSCLLIEQGEIITRTFYKQHAFCSGFKGPNTFNNALDPSPLLCFCVCLSVLHSQFTSAIFCSDLTVSTLLRVSWSQFSAVCTRAPARLRCKVRCQMFFLSQKRFFQCLWAAASLPHCHLLVSARLVQNALSSKSFRGTAKSDVI